MISDNPRNAAAGHCGSAGSTPKMLLWPRRSRSISCRIALVRVYSRFAQLIASGQATANALEGALNNSSHRFVDTQNVVVTISDAYLSGGASTINYPYTAYEVFVPSETIAVRLGALSYAVDKRHGSCRRGFSVPCISNG